MTTTQYRTAPQPKGVPMDDLFKNKSKASKEKPSRVSDEVSMMLLEIFKSLLIILCFGITVPIKQLQIKDSKLSSMETRSVKVVTFATLLIGLALGILFLIPQSPLILKVCSAFISFWFLSFAITFGFLRIFRMKPDNDFITTADLKNSIKDFEKRRSDFKILEALMENPSELPLGINLKDSSPVTLPVKQVLEHSLSSGATGQGKTTLLKTKIHHFIKHRRPVIIIDPKGERKDVEEIRDLCAQYGRADSFKLFSLSDKEASAFYNVVKVGDPQQLKAKVMNGLNLSHEYYGAVADEFLTTIFDAHAILKREITLQTLSRYIVNPRTFSELEKDIRNLPQSYNVDLLLEQFAAARKIESKDMKGLSAQLASLNALNIRDILNPGDNREEIDLANTLQNGGVAYFQMNINGYSSIARAIGKLIVQDLRLVSNMIQSGQAIRAFDYAFISIDEFGSFVYSDFADYIKQVRSAGIGIDLSFQVIADTRQVSPEFADQVLGNTATKFILRQDIKQDVETWAAMAGTKDTTIQSYQTAKSLVGDAEQTGLGNIHEGKSILIDFDVFKQLTTGHAVMIDKKRHKNVVFAIWDGKITKTSTKAKSHKPTITNGIAVRKIELKGDKNA